jgi:multisubunit Na+/H+ antiporter MnhG subunit
MNRYIIRQSVSLLKKTTHSFALEALQQVDYIPASLSTLSLHLILLEVCFLVATPVTSHNL